MINDQENLQPYSSRSNNNKDEANNSITDGDTPYKTQKKYRRNKQKTNKIIVQEEPHQMVANLVDHFPEYMKIRWRING